MIKIEKGVPLSHKAAISEEVIAAKEMEVGDSFLMENATLNKINSLRGSLSRLGNKRFTVRKVAEGYRCWRTE